MCVKCIIDVCLGIHHNADNSHEEHDPHCVNAKFDIWIVWVMLGCVDSSVEIGGWILYEALVVS